MITKCVCKCINSASECYKYLSCLFKTLFKQENESLSGYLPQGASLWATIGDSDKCQRQNKYYKLELTTQKSQIHISHQHHGQRHGLLMTRHSEGFRVMTTPLISLLPGAAGGAFWDLHHYMEPNACSKLSHSIWLVVRHIRGGVNERITFSYPLLCVQ